MTDTNEQKWKEESKEIWKIYRYGDGHSFGHLEALEMGYLAARKKAHSENEDAFKAFTLDLADRYENKIEKRDKLLGKYFRIIKKYRSYLSEDDDEIIHEANKDYEETME